MGRLTRRVPRTRFNLTTVPVGRLSRPDTVVVEEPLEIRLGAQTVSSTMRTPGDDFDLVLGHLISEGLIATGAGVSRMMHCTDTDDEGRPTFNVVEVSLAEGVELVRQPTMRAERGTSACGICGSESIMAVVHRAPYAAATAPRPPLDPARVPEFLASLRARQTVWAKTGGLHAAALFDLGRPDQVEPLVVREDVGRHNAVDKVIGWAAREQRLPLHDVVLVVTARAGFEIAAKAASVGIPVLVAASAPTSLAVDLAEKAGMTLIAFARDTDFSAYTGAQRITKSGRSTNSPAGQDDPTGGEGELRLIAPWGERWGHDH
ncbi:MAG: formate dehydrogenase accessory sulfurtransferase FdhD [Nostocoides sp.]